MQKNNEFNVNLYYQNENDTIRTYQAYLGKILIGDCQITLYKNYLTIFSINIFENYQQQGYGKKLVNEMENLAKQLGYSTVIMEWSQEDENYTAPRKLALSCGYKPMEEGDYHESSYPLANSNRINYIKKFI